ncbi:MAG: hypothetical protein KC442_04615 [Thermomicrobiales bacterium]|nr:hypothetical protein [Thermomicrobiales bacterium]
MWKAGVIVAMVALGGVALPGSGPAGTAAQDAASADLAGHPLVGTWVVDTNVDLASDAPEIGIFTADGSVFGLGASRWVSGVWEVADDHTGAVTMAGVFEGNGGGYVVLRGQHEVDESGSSWTCACTFTVVGAGGAVLDSGQAIAHAVRLPMELADAAGQPLKGFPIWAPQAVATHTP